MYVCTNAECCRTFVATFTDPNIWEKGKDFINSSNYGTMVDQP